MPVKSVESCRKFVQVSIQGKRWVRPCGLWSCQQCAQTYAKDYGYQIKGVCLQSGPFFADWSVVYYRTSPSSKWKGRYAKQIERKAGDRLRVVTWAGVDHILSSRDPVAAGWEPSLLLTPADARQVLHELLDRRMVKRKPRANKSSLWQFREPKSEADPKLGDVHRAFLRPTLELYRQYAWERCRIRLLAGGAPGYELRDEEIAQLQECWTDAKAWVLLAHQAEAAVEEELFREAEARDAESGHAWAVQHRVWAT